MPSTTAMDTTRARVIRPILLNVMRFLNPRRPPDCDAPQLRATLWGYKCLTLIVEAAASLRHFPKKQLQVASCRLQVASCPVPEVGSKSVRPLHQNHSSCPQLTTCNLQQTIVPKRPSYGSSDTSSGPDGWSPPAMWSRSAACSGWYTSHRRSPACP